MRRKRSKKKKVRERREDCERPLRYETKGESRERVGEKRRVNERRG